MQAYLARINAANAQGGNILTEHRKHHRLKKITPERLQKFIEALASNGGFASRACEVVGLSRHALYKFRRENKEFAAAWDIAVTIGADLFEEECMRRAFDGVDEPVFYQGDVCGHVRKYSDHLAGLILRGSKPDKYRERQEITGPDGKPLVPGNVTFYLPEKRPLKEAK